MTGGKHIRAVGQEAETKAQSEEDTLAETAEAHDGVAFRDAIEPEEELELSEEDIEDALEIATPPTAPNWLIPTLAFAAIFAWTAFYGWALQEQIISGSLSLQSWTQIVIDWSVPVLLVGIAWLLAMRNSTTEANRFAQSASLLSQESRELESRLIVVNRELSLAREFLGAQSRELESLGRVAGERISNHAETLQSLIKDNGEQVEAIGSASESALSNMSRLRDDLPVLANSARDVSNQVGAAGRTAHDNLDKLVEGFERLNQFGKASENQVASFESRVGKILVSFQDQLNQIEETAGLRLEEVETRTKDYRGELELAENTAVEALNQRLVLLDNETKALGDKLREAEEQAMEQLAASKSRFEGEIIKAIEGLDAVDANAISLAQTRVDELNEKVAQFTDQLEARDRQFNEQVSRVQETFSTHEAQASEILAQRLSDLDDALAQRREVQNAETEKLAANSLAITEQIEQLTSLISSASSQGKATSDTLSTSLSVLDAQLEDKRQKLSETEAEIAKLTETGVRLLEIIQSSAAFTREDLPEAMESALGKLGDVEERAQEVETLMLATNQKANDLSQYLVEARSNVDANDEAIDALQLKIASQSDEALTKIQSLQGGLSSLSQESENLAGATEQQLGSAITKLEQTTKEVFATLETGTHSKVEALANSISAKAVSELERSLRNDTAEAVGKLEQAAAHASGVGREATVQLRDQLAKVNELTVNLEQRIARARELAEEQVNNDFARRMALITDSLNSSAIDLTSAISQEVSDTSWDAYLKGDRGIFTRRAVRLIDSGEAREIADLYQSDDEFKANVSRYIHDFEAMLRSVLSTREGKALGVTVLGSDVGKLYVVLAQSIERLRQ